MALRPWHGGWRPRQRRLPPGAYRGSGRRSHLLAPAGAAPAVTGRPTPAGPAVATRPLAPSRPPAPVAPWGRSGRSWRARRRLTRPPLDVGGEPAAASMRAAASPERRATWPSAQTSARWRRRQHCWVRWVRRVRGAPARRVPTAAVLAGAANKAPAASVVAPARPGGRRHAAPAARRGRPAAECAAAPPPAGQLRTTGSPRWPPRARGGGALGSPSRHASETRTLCAVCRRAAGGRTATA